MTELAVAPATEENPSAAADTKMPVFSHGTIPFDRVLRATQNLTEERHRRITLDLHRLMTDNGWTTRDLCGRLKVSGATISQLFNAKYETKGGELFNRLEVFVASEKKIIELAERRKEFSHMPFVETSLSKKIWGVCDRAREFQKIGMIIGIPQIGKSVCLMEYARRNNHGSTVYVVLPARCTLSGMLRAFAEAFNISVNINTDELRHRIKEAIFSHMLIIIDEAHQCMPVPGYNNLRGIQCMEYIREIWNAKHCGVVYSATDVFKRAFSHPDTKALLEQTRRRIAFDLLLPKKPTRADMDKFSAEYNLPPAEGEALALEQDIIGNDGMESWLTLLQFGKKLSGTGVFTWKHVIKANAGRLKLSGVGRNDNEDEE